MKKTALLCLFSVSMLLSVDASADVYMWENEAGIVSFADDPGNIPAKFRKKAKLVSHEVPEESADTVTDEKLTESKTAPAGDDPKIGSTKSEPSAKLYGGKDEVYWSNAFRKVKADLASYKEQLEVINKKLSMPDNMSRSDYKSFENTRKYLEDLENTAKNKLESLTIDADNSGVPFSIR